MERQNSQIKESELDLKQQLQHEQHEEEEHASKLIESENALRNLASQLREREAAGEILYNLQKDCVSILVLMSGSSNDNKIVKILPRETCF